MLSEAEIASVRREVRKTVATGSSCVPAGAILLTMAGGEQALTLRPLTFSRILGLPCLLHRVVTYSWMNYTDFPTINVQTAASLPTYFEFNWIKWHLIATALLEASQVFFFDADVLFLRNPFASLPASAADFELLYQFEGPGSNPLNGGQLLARSRAATLEVIAAMPPPESEAFRSRLDQEIAYEALRASGRPITRLGEAFAGNCWFGPPEAPPWCGLATFHAHCTGSLAEKRRRLQLVLHETRGCAERPWAKTRFNHSTRSQQGAERRLRVIGQ